MAHWVKIYFEDIDQSKQFEVTLQHSRPLSLFYILSNQIRQSGLEPIGCTFDGNRVGSGVGKGAIER